MSFISDNERINKQINSVYEFYKQFFNPNVSNVLALVTNNYFRDFKEITGFYPHDTNCRATYFAPNDAHSEHIILIKEETFNMKTYQHVATIFHELIHIEDYINFSNSFCNGDITKVVNHKNYKGFRFWSEFHAKYQSILHTLTYMGTIAPECRYSNEQYSDIFTNIFLPQYIDILKDNIKEMDVTIDNIATFFGRFYICQFFNHDLSFPKDVPAYISKYNSGIEPLYTSFKHSLNFESASSSFGQYKTLSETIVKPSILMGSSLILQKAIRSLSNLFFRS